MVEQIGIGVADERIQRHVFPRNDQILEVDRAAEAVSTVDDIDRCDIVVFTGLPNQLVHGLANGKALVDADVIGGDETADLVVIIGIDEQNRGLGLVVDHRAQLDLDAFVDALPQVDRVVRVHFVDDRGQLVDADLVDVLDRIVNVGDDLGQPFRVQCAVQQVALGTVQIFQTLRDVVVVVIPQLLPHFLHGGRGADDPEDLFCEDRFL